MAEPLMTMPATPYDQAAGNPPASTSAKEGAPGASVGSGTADRLFSAFTSFYQGLCWVLAISSALLGYAGSVTGLDWEILLVWQVFMILTHSACVVARVWQGLPPLPTGAITKVVCMSFALGLSEPMDALRDPIVAAVFLQYGRTVGYLSAALTLLAVVSSTIVILQDTHSFEEHKGCSGWALYFLPGEPLADSAHAADHTFLHAREVAPWLGGHAADHTFAGEIVPGTWVRIMDDPKHMSAICEKHGCSWSSAMNHMNGKPCIVHSLFVEKGILKIYDQDLDARGLQDGLIDVPLECVSRVQSRGYVDGALLAAVMTKPLDGQSASTFVILDRAVHCRLDTGARVSYAEAFAASGSTVRGVETEDGWLQVGHWFLPLTENGDVCVERWSCEGNEMAAEQATIASLGYKVSSYFRIAAQCMVSKTSPLHQNLLIYEEVPQGLAILLFSLFGEKSSFVLAVGAITATKVIMTMVVRPYLLAWQSTYSTWSRVSPRDIERTVRVKCIGSAHLAGCCSSLASDCKQHPDIRAAALHGFRELLGRGDALEIDRYRLRELLTSQSVLQFNYPLAKDAAKPLFHDSDHLERNFRMARDLHSAGELTEEGLCCIIDEMTRKMFALWPLEPHIQALCDHDVEDVRNAASKAMQELRKVLSERGVPAAAAEARAMPGQRFEGKGGLVHYEPGDKGAVVSDTYLDAEGNLTIKVYWGRTGLTSEEVVKDWTERFRIVGRASFSVGDAVEASQSLEGFYEPEDSGRVVSELYIGDDGGEHIDILWKKSGVWQAFTLTSFLVVVRIVERAPSLSVGHEVEALPWQRLEGKGKGVVCYEGGDTGRVVSLYYDADWDRRVKVTWYRSGITTDQSMVASRPTSGITTDAVAQSWMDIFKIVGHPHSISVGDEVEALPGSRAEGAGEVVHEPGDRGAVTRLPDGDERILVLWYKTGLTGDEHCASAWMQRLRFVGKARVPSLGDEVEALPGKRFEDESGAVFYEPLDKGKVSTEPREGWNGDEMIKIAWHRTGNQNAEMAKNLLKNFRVV